jgi:hypothetical protein
MKDARWFGVGLVVFAGALEGCGADHVVGSGTSGAGATAGVGGAGFSGVGGDSVIGGTGDAGGNAGSLVGGSGGSSGRVGGTSGTGGAAMAGTGGNGNSRGGSAGRSGGSGGDTGGVLADGGSSGAPLGGSGGSTGSGEGGAAGEAGGAGPGPIQCSSTTVRGTLTDSMGSTDTAGFQGPATITSINRPDPAGSSVEFALRTPDDLEWHYNVTLPCLYTGPLPVGATPELGVQTGDTVEVDIVGSMSNFFSEHQAIVMVHDGRLVVFTVDEAEIANPTPIDLSSYGFDVRIEPASSGLPVRCSASTGKDVFERLVVTKDSETMRVEASETALMDGFTFSVEQLGHLDSSGGCDPPGWSRYGGFRMQP